MFRWSNSILGLSATLVLSCSSLRAEEPAAMHAHTKVREVPQKSKDLFLEALLKDKVLQVSPAALEPKVQDKKLVDVWAGNKPEMDVSLTDILLTFVRPAGAHKNNRFDLSVRIEGGSLYVRSTLPASQRMAGGIRIDLRGNKPRRVLMQGFDLSGVVIAAPAIEDVGLRGVLICPKDFVREDQVIRSPILVDTGFRVESVQLSASAHAEGRVLTGSNIGMSRVNIATSHNIPNPASFFDVSYTKDPLASVNYLPSEEPPVIKVTSGRMLEGIEAILELQTAGGFKRTTYMAESLLLEPFSKDVKFTIYFLGRSFTVAALDCLLLLQQRTQEQTYTQEELKIPGH